MTMFLTVFAFFLMMVAAMAVGVMFGRKPISGSCGGIANTGVSKGPCEFCGGDPNACESPELSVEAKAPYVELTQKASPRS
jgi:hypothetical protein